VASDLMTELEARGMALRVQGYGDPEQRRSIAIFKAMLKRIEGVPAPIAPKTPAISGQKVGEINLTTATETTSYAAVAGSPLPYFRRASFLIGMTRITPRMPWRPIAMRADSYI